METMKMGMFDTCKMSHEHKDMLKEKMTMGMVDKSISISDRELLMYIALNLMCSDDVMEATRKYAYMPANAKIAEADGIYTVHIDDKSHFMHDLKGHDMNKVFEHLIKYMDNLKATDMAKYNTLIATIKS